MSFVGSFLSSITQIGNASEGLSDERKRMMLIFTISGTVVAVLLFCYVTVVAKREFTKMAAEMRLGSTVHPQCVNGVVNEPHNIASFTPLSSSPQKEHVKQTTIGLKVDSQSGSRIDIQTPTQRFLGTPEHAQPFVVKIPSITEFAGLELSEEAATSATSATTVSEQSRDGLISSDTQSRCSMNVHRDRPN